MFIFHFLSSCYFSAANHFLFLQIIDCFTSIWVSRFPSLIFLWKNLVNSRSYLDQHFLSKVQNFELQKSKWKNFSAHQKENFLSFSKLTLLLFLVPFLWELWPVKTWGRFFWDTLHNIDMPESKVPSAKNFTTWTLPFGVKSN